MLDIPNVGADARHKRGFGKAMGFGQRSALLLIDMVQGFTDPNLPLGSSVDSAIEQANRLIDGARKAGIPVFFSTILYEEPHLADAGLWVHKIDGLKTLTVTSPAVEQDPPAPHRERCNPQEKIRQLFLRHRSGHPVADTRCGYACHGRVFDQRVCARNRGRCLSIRLPPYRRTGGCRRQVSSRPCAEPSRHRRVVRRRDERGRHTFVSGGGFSLGGVGGFDQDECGGERNDGCEVPLSLLAA